MHRPEVITARYRWTRDEFLQLQGLALRQIPQARWVFRFMFGMGAVMIGCGLLGLRQHTISQGGFIAYLLGGLACFSTPFWARFKAHRLYDQKPDREMELAWEIDHERVSARSDVAATEVKWPAVRRVVRVRQGFMIFLTEQSLLWLPLHAFAGAPDVNRFAALAQTKARTYAEHR